MSEIISLNELRAKVQADPATKAMFRPSAKNAVVLDVDGDGPSDFAFFCSDLRRDTLDTIAIDATNDGDFDLYIFNCMDADKAEIVVYPPNSDVPMNITAEDGSALIDAETIANYIDVISNFNGETFAKFFLDLKAKIVEKYNKGLCSGAISLREMRAKMQADPTVSKMLRPAAKNGILVDVDGDGPADFAFLCSDLKGDTLDTFAIDVFGTGEFDVYIFNCMDPEKSDMVAYAPNSYEPVSAFSAEATAAYKALISDVEKQLRNFDGAAFAAFFQGLKKMIAENYQK